MKVPSSWMKRPFPVAWADLNAAQEIPLRRLGAEFLLA
ncbi:Uncharacterised protein [Corynebacterium striatum]|nr:Uncharacterised protein [Corynebacterium striatum]